MDAQAVIDALSDLESAVVVSVIILGKSRESNGEDQGSEESGDDQSSESGESDKKATSAQQKICWKGKEEGQGE